MLKKRGREEGIERKGERAPTHILAKCDIEENPVAANQARDGLVESQAILVKCGEADAQCGDGRPQHRLAALGASAEDK